MVCNLLDIRRKIRMWVSIHVPFGGNLGIAKCLHRNNYPWMIHHTLPFCLSACISPSYTKFSLLCLLQHCCEGYSADTAQVNSWEGSYAYDIALSSADLAVASYYNRISWQYVCPSGKYTTYGDAYFSWIDNKLQYEPLQLSCHSQGPKSIVFCRF